MRLHLGVRVLDPQVPARARARIITDMEDLQRVSLLLPLPRLSPARISLGLALRRPFPDTLVLRARFRRSRSRSRGRSRSRSRGRGRHCDRIYRRGNAGFSLGSAARTHTIHGHGRNAGQGERTGTRKVAALWHPPACKRTSSTRSRAREPRALTSLSLLKLALEEEPAGDDRPDA